MNDVNLPSYAKLPNGPHEPNVSPRGVMVVEEPHKMAKTLMKFAHSLAKPKSARPHGKHSAKPNRTTKKDQTKWY